MRSPRKPIAILKFNGPRFDDHGLDVDVLSEIVAYKRLLQETAKELWRRKHPERQRLPKSFDTELSLKFFELEAGSTGVPLERATPIAAAPRLPFDDELEEAVRVLERSIGMAAGEQLPPKELPRSVVSLFQDFGKALRPDEFIALSNGNSSKFVRYDRQIRERIVSWSSMPYTDVVDLTGEVRGTDLDGLRFTLRIPDGRKVSGRFEPEQESVLLEALGEHSSRRLRVLGEGEFSPDDGSLQQITKIRQFEILENEAPSLAPIPIWVQLAEIGARVPEDEWDTVPTDLASNVDAYLYGTKKGSQ
jgi:hypothetical protein